MGNCHCGYSGDCYVEPGMARGAVNSGYCHYFSTYARDLELFMVMNEFRYVTDSVLQKWRNEG
jgi:hypothetical protein